MTRSTAIRRAKTSPGRLRGTTRAGCAVLLALVALLTLAGCGGSSDNSTDAASAKSCEQLVDRAARVARTVVESVQGKTVADLEAANPKDPFAPLEAPFATFRARAEELHCDTGELRRLACTAYQGIDASGPVAEEFLARTRDVCR